MVSGHGTTELAVVAFENRATKYVVKSLESFKSLPYIFENLILEARYKAQERTMREQKERSERIHRNIVENALAGIYILQDGLFHLVNPKLGEIFGCAPDSLIGTHFWQLVRPDDMECVSKRYGRGCPRPSESRCERRSHAGSVSDGSIEYEGRRGILGNLVDITPRKEKEIELLRNNRELTAINSIMERTIRPEGEMDRDLGDCLSDVVSGIDDVEVGGIFLLEKGNIVLRALFGSVEDLMSFTECKESNALLGAPKAHHADEDYIWTSVPIICNEQPKGAIVIATLKDAAPVAIPFLEKVAVYIGRLVEVASLRSPLHQAPKEELLQTEKTED
jgi:PAS domain S-box-containing protein